MTVVAESDEVWEQVTLGALWSEPVGEAALYCHTKGLTTRNEGEWPNWWRRSMVKGVVGNWRLCVELLGRCQAVGCHWLTPESFPGLVTSPYFGGNMWSARRELVERLEAPRLGTRHDAEAWVGSAEPRPSVADLSPGWPSVHNLL